MPHLVWDETEIRQGQPRLKRADEPRKPTPYRLLVEDEGQRVQSASGLNDNLLIHGDNLQALQSLLPYYAGQVKCIFIDPPYNTGSAFTHYDDGIEHSAWLSMMQPRLRLLREFLRPDGSIWVTIDDNEAHYLKVLMDQVFGRGEFVADIFWQKNHTRENRTDIATVHDHLMVFAKNRERWKEVRNLLPASDSQLGRFTNLDDDPRGAWASLPAHAKAEKGRRQEQFFTIITPSGRKIDPPPGRCWLYTEERFAEMVADNRIWFGANGSNAPRVKKFLSEVQAGLVPSTLWLHDEVGTNGQAKAEITNLFPNKTPFSTPKPERLIQRIIHVATNAGDLILDSFLGSGTTAAVAHKMGRRWIGIEMGDHARTHCLPRMRKVVAGEQGGISEAVNWKGGGGFRYYSLGEPIRDEAGHINPSVRFNELAAHLWFSDIGAPWPGQPVKSPLLGVHEDKAKNKQTAYALFYNGVWGEDCPDNTLSPARLTKLKSKLPDFAGEWVIYAHFIKQLSDARLAREKVSFRQLPHGVVGDAR